MSQSRRSSIHGSGSPTLSGGQQHQVVVSGTSIGAHDGQIPRGIPLPGMVQPSRSIQHEPSHGFVNPLGPTGLAQVASSISGSAGGSSHAGSPGLTRSALATTGMPIRPAVLHQGIGHATFVPTLSLRNTESTSNTYPVRTYTDS